MRLSDLEYTNSQIEHLIDEHIHKKRDRDVLKSRMIDGLIYEELSEHYELSVQQVKTIVYRGLQKITPYLKEPPD